jgi:hypothetical protein
MTRAKITAEQSQAVAASQGEPVYLIDDTGRDAALAIVRVDLLKELLLKELTPDSDFDVSETYRAQEAALGPIWNKPELDEYTDEDGSPID